MKEIFDSASVAALLPREIPYRVTVCDQSPSTNSQVKALAEGGEDAWYVLIAKRQTAGRGRMGRSFYSPEGTGLYLSILLHPDLSRPFPLTVTAAVAGVRAVESVCGVSLQIKWVNDLYLEGKKVCGILAEGAYDPQGRLSYAVCGVGFNLRTPEGGFPEELKEIAGVLCDGRDGDLRPALAAAFLREFYTASHEDPASVIDFYRRRSLLLGKWITSPNGAFEGSAWVEAVDDLGRLVVRLSDGTKQALFGGEVSVRQDLRRKEE